MADGLSAAVRGALGASSGTLPCDLEEPLGFLWEARHVMGRVTIANDPSVLLRGFADNYRLEDAGITRDSCTRRAEHGGALRCELKALSTDSATTMTSRFSAPHSRPGPTSTPARPVGEIADLASHPSDRPFGSQAASAA
ncbi:MAG: hypothetical protein AB7V62_02615 [Thermoleophilia bacterium]